MLLVLRLEAVSASNSSFSKVNPLVGRRRRRDEVGIRSNRVVRRRRATVPLLLRGVVVLLKVGLLLVLELVLRVLSRRRWRRQGKEVLGLTTGARSGERREGGRGHSRVRSPSASTTTREGGVEGGDRSRHSWPREEIRVASSTAAVSSTGEAVRSRSTTSDELENLRFRQTSGTRDRSKFHSTDAEGFEATSEYGRFSDSGGDLLDGRVVLALNHSPNGLERNSESTGEFSNLLDLLVALGTAPTKSNARLAVDGEVVHLDDSKLGIDSTNELNESTPFPGGDFAIGDISEMVEEALETREKVRWSVSRFNKAQVDLKKLTLRVSSLIQAGNPPTNTVVLLGSVVWGAGLAGPPPFAPPPNAPPAPPPPPPPPPPMIADLVAELLFEWLLYAPGETGGAKFEPEKVGERKSGW